LSLTLREEYRLRVFEKCRGDHLDLRQREQQEHGENCIMMSFIICKPSPNIVRVIKSRMLGWTGYIAGMER
jgi:hypothetical protein